jgi:hypothetical protein
MDLSHIPLAPRSKLNGATGTYYYLGYDLILFFSSVELRAQISWEENVSRRPILFVIEPPSDLLLSRASRRGNLCLQYIKILTQLQEPRKDCVRP